ncbi:MAG: A/G-specific adenine glycosylase [Phycisphaeraceae bacterium]|nr:A/G-specific adenine glycosylase [Phycisphaeraceae bacterium]
MARQHKSNPTPQTIRKIRHKLLAWYNINRRELPWRTKGTQTPVPYQVLVSEFMLQQTQVATVIDYFDRFLKHFPTIEALALAPVQQVLLLWQGLGYYRRARNLHAAAKKIVQENHGQIPANLAAIASLPGVGRYTAGAIASIAFEIRAPVLDGNVARVLSRWFAIEEPIDKSTVRSHMWSLAEMLVPEVSPGDFNQAMMELGALVCTPRNPQCSTCPIADLCRARSHGLTNVIPRRSLKRGPQEVMHHVLVVKRGRRFIIEQRPLKGLWAGLWQMPTAEMLNAHVTAKQIQNWALQHLGVIVDLPRPAGNLRHQTTHRSIIAKVWITDVVEGKLHKSRGQWRTLDNLHDLPMSILQQNVVVLIPNSI